MSIVTKPFGRDGGREFDIEAVKSLGFRSGGRIDALLLNGIRHGGNGGKEGTTREFQPDEFIESITIRHGARIDAVEIHTNAGNTLSGGGKGGVEEKLTNIRVLGFGGRSGKELDKLRVRFIKNYTEPTLVEENQAAIINLVAPGESIERSEFKEISRLSASKQVMETVFSASASAESAALGNYIAKLTASTSITRTSMREIVEEVKTKEETAEKKTYLPPKGSAGLEMVQVDVFREEDGFAWMIPVSKSGLISVSLEKGLSPSISAYDLTGHLAAQIPTMADRLEKRNGFYHYSAATG